MSDIVYDVRVWNSILKWKLPNNGTARNAGVKKN